MNSQWSDNLRKRMEKHQEPSPEGLWEDIEQIMKKENSLRTLPRQNRILLWGKRIGVVAAMALTVLFVGNYLFNEKNPGEFQKATQEKHTPSKPESNFYTPQGDERKHVAENREDRAFSHDRNKIINSISEKYTNLKKTETLISKTTGKERPKDEVEKEDSPKDSNTEKKAGKNSSTSKRKKLDYKNGDDLDVYLSMIRQRNKSQKWETSVYASNISSGSTKEYDGYGSFVSGDVPPETDEEELALGEDPYENILYENKYKEVYTDIKHRQPVTMGISVNYNINEKWSITSGLTYTILSSELRSGSDSYYYKSEQTLHNMGIPLNINYNIWRDKKLSFYVSGGGHIEKNISGKLRTDYIIDNKIESTNKDKISIDQLQWSLNVAAGIQYNFSRKTGLYVEPGGSYYFKNESEVETIYKEKPINFSLKFGLRFSLNK